jgi:hypothetical protein
LTDNAAKGRWLDLRPHLYAILAAIVVFLPLLIVSNLDVLYLFIVVPILLIIGLCVLIYAAVRRNLRVALALAVFWTASALLFIYPSEVRSPIKWLLWSSEYKKRVLAQPNPSNSDFKHIEWDGWGLSGIDTTIYLVFDPTDSLAAAAKSHQPGKFNGVPCKVPWVRRMQSHWYTVMFYTDKDWGGCSFEADRLRSQKNPSPGR